MSEQSKTGRANSGALKPARVTKKVQLERLVSRRKGVGIAELEQTLGWQPHTVRAAISGLRKGGMVITCAKSNAGPVYKLQPATAGRA